MIGWIMAFFRALFRRAPPRIPIARVTVVTRRDLSGGQQAVQSAHAFHQFLAAKYREKREVDDSCTLVFLTVPDEAALGVLTKKATKVAIEVATFHEPDLDNALTAIALGHGVRQGYWYHAWGVPLGLSFNDQFSRVMSCIPETAPKGESHVLQTASLVKDIQYTSKEIKYVTAGRSYDYVTLRSAPKVVRAGDRTLPMAADPQNQPNSYHFDSHTGLLRVQHESPAVDITLQ